MKHRTKIELTYVFDNEYEMKYFNRNFPLRLELAGTINVTLSQLHLFRRLKKHKTNPVIRDVYDTVLDYYNTSDENSHEREYVKARQIAHYICCEYLNKPKRKYTLTEIGATIGGRIHATVLYSSRTIKDLLSYDRELKKEVKEILNILNYEIQVIY